MTKVILLLCALCLIPACYGKARNGTIVGISKSSGIVNDKLYVRIQDDFNCVGTYYVVGNKVAAAYDMKYRPGDRVVYRTARMASNTGNLVILRRIEKGPERD